MKDAELHTALHIEFVESAFWLSEKLEQRTPEAVFRWVSRRVKDPSSQRRRFLDMYRLHHPHVGHAVVEMTRFLRRIIEQTSMMTCQRSEPTRMTNWGLTLAKSETPFPTRFFEPRRKTTPNRALKGAVFSVAQRLHHAAKLCDLHSSEWEELDAVLQKTRSMITPRTFSSRYIRELQRVDPECASALRALNRIWSLELDEKSFRTAIQEFDKALGDDFSIFESVVTVAVGRAIETTSVAGEPWEFLRARDDKKNAPYLMFRAGTLLVHLFSGVPDDVNTPFRDQLVKVYQAMVNDGKNSKHDYAPDLVIQFTDERLPTGESVWAIADAKWSKNENHRSYLKESMKGTGTAYLFAFAPALGLKDDCGAYRTKLMPAITFFVAGGLTSIAEAPLSNIEEVVQTLRNKNNLPIISAIPFEHMMFRDGKAPEVLCAWFERLAEDARRLLAVDNPERRKRLSTSEVFS